MQYTSKLVILAVALFSTSGLAAPLISDVGVIEEVIPLDCEIHIGDWKTEAERLQYIDRCESHDVGYEDSEWFGTWRHIWRHRGEMNRLFNDDRDAWLRALHDHCDEDHGLAVEIFLENQLDFLRALRNEDNEYHAEAVHRDHRREAMLYFRNRHHFWRALHDRHHRFHSDALTFMNMDRRFRREAMHKVGSIFQRDAIRLQHLLDDTCGLYDGGHGHFFDLGIGFGDHEFREERHLEHHLEHHLD